MAAPVYQQDVSCDGCSTLQYFTQNNVSGSTLFAIVRFGDTTSVPSLSDNVNINWGASDADASQTTDGHRLWIYHFDNSASTIKATITVANFGGSSHRMIIAEVTGLASSSSFDKSSSAQGNSTTPDSGATATTSQASEIFIGAASNATTANTMSIGTNIAWTGFVSGVKVFSEYFIAGSAQSVTAQFSQTLDQWACLVATYKASGGAAAVTPAPSKTIIRNAIIKNWIIR